MNTDRLHKYELTNIFKFKCLWLQKDKGAICFTLRWSRLFAVTYLVYFVAVAVKLHHHLPMNLMWLHFGNQPRGFKE